jgi:predicted DsbA family dithiol-disulfide isomerase
MNQIKERERLEIKERERLESAGTVLHWYDFICPFCYIGQQRNATLRRHGLRVVEMAFQAHPEIPPGGIAAGSRQGPMYAMLEREAKDAGLTFNWPPRLPNSKRALAAAEWVRQQQPDHFAQFQKDLFAAHFVLGEDLGDPAVIDRHASVLGIDVKALHVALADGSALRAVQKSESLGRQYGVHGTPAWFLAERLISGLLPASDFERIAQAAEKLER